MFTPEELPGGVSQLDDRNYKEYFDHTFKLYLPGAVPNGAARAIRAGINATGVRFVYVTDYLPFYDFLSFCTIIHHTRIVAAPFLSKLVVHAFAKAAPEIEIN